MHTCISVILNAYKWLVARLLVDSAARVGDQLKAGKDGFTARNDSQAYFSRSLSLAFIEVSTLFFLSEIPIAQLGERWTLDPRSRV